MFMASQPQRNRARRILRLLRGLPASDATDMTVTRIVGTETLPHLDPFLLLESWSGAAGGSSFSSLPDQPQHGFDVVTYMTRGGVRYRDSHGNAALTGAGEVQWTTAGRGLIQSLAPVSDDSGMQGFQLWLNLPAADKAQARNHRVIPAAEIPVITFHGGEMRLLAGRHHGVQGPITSPSRPFIADIILRHEGDIAMHIPEDHQGFIYVYEGGVAVEQALINPGQIGLLEPGNVLNLTAGAGGARALVCSAHPLNQTIVRHGPFVSNS